MSYLDPKPLFQSHFKLGLNCNLGRLLFIINILFDKIFYYIYLTAFFLVFTEKKSDFIPSILFLNLFNYKLDDFGLLD